MEDRSANCTSASVGRAGRRCTWLSLGSPVVAELAAKDRPVLFTAAAWADVLLTLDTADFLALLGDRFYALQVLTPGMFLELQRATEELRLDS